MPEMNENNFNWSATDFFRRLTASNRLAHNHGFRFELVSSLEGFHSCLTDMLSTRAFVAVSDTSQGYTTLDNTPHTRRVKLVFLAMRHKEGDMLARERCLDIMRELFRQFMSVLIQEKTLLEENCLYLDRRISFEEIDRYFYTGCACAFFQIAIDTYTDLRYDPEEWILPDNPQRLTQ